MKGLTAFLSDAYNEQHPPMTASPPIRPELRPPVVFLLGAGASAPYGFPLGEELKAQVHNTLPQLRMPPPSGTSAFSQEHCAGMQKILAYGSHRTIDEILEQHPKYRPLGAYLVAATILAQENEHRLLSPKDWYHVFFKWLFLSKNPIRPDQLSVITLNYDRSFEAFPEHYIEVDVAEHDQPRCKKRVSDLKIIHAHGCLGSLKQIPYGSGHKPQSPTTSMAADSIWLPFDRVQERQEFVNAQREIEKASTIVVLGHGYHKRTIIDLGLAHHPSASIVGTARGIALPEISRILHDLGADEFLCPVTARELLSVLLLESHETKLEPFVAQSHS